MNYVARYSYEGDEGIPLGMILSAKDNEAAIKKAQTKSLEDLRAELQKRNDPREKIIFLKGVFKAKEGTRFVCGEQIFP